jgi:hypothetical protein
MMEALLGVKTCDKCGKMIKKTQEVFFVSDGKIVHSNEMLGLEYSQIYFVCHKDCWDGNVDMGWE